MVTYLNVFLFFHDFSILSNLSKFLEIKNCSFKFAKYKGTIARLHLQNTEEKVLVLICKIQTEYSKPILWMCGTHSVEFFKSIGKMGEQPKLLKMYWNIPKTKIHISSSSRLRNFFQLLFYVSEIPASKQTSEGKSQVGHLSDYYSIDRKICQFICWFSN